MVSALAGEKPVLSVPGWNPAGGARGPHGAAHSYGGDNHGRLRIFSGTAHPALAAEVAQYLGQELGGITIKKFADGERDGD